MPRTKRPSQGASGGGRGGFDEYEDADPVYQLDNPLAKPSLGTSVKTSKRSYHKLDKSKYKLKRFDIKDKNMWYKDHTSCKKQGPDPYNTVDWSKSTLVAKHRLQDFKRRSKKELRGDWLRSNKPTRLAHGSLRSAAPRETSATLTNSRRVPSFSETVRKSPLKYSGAFISKDKRFADPKWHRVPQEYDQRLGPGVYETNQSSLRVAESRLQSPSYRSRVPRFAAFGSSRNTQNYHKRKNWSTKYMKERFRFHSPNSQTL